MEQYYSRNNGFFERFSHCVVYAADPGAWAVLSRFARLLQGRGKRVAYWLEGWAAEHAGDVPGSEALAGLGDLDRFPREGTLVVYGAQRQFSRNYQVVAACRDRGMATLFVFDSWKNYRINFHDRRTGRLYLPSKIAVIDARMRKDLADALADVTDASQALDIDCLGQPALEESAACIRDLPEAQREALRKRCNPGGKRVSVFVMEPVLGDYIRTNGIDPGYDECKILCCFFDRFASRSDKVLIKMHPRQTDEDVKRVRQCIPDGMDAEILFDEKVEHLMAIADAVFGMTSIALNAAIMAGVKTYSIQTGRNEYGRTMSNPALEECLVE